MKVVTSDQMRRIENALIKTLGVPSIILMENAARGILEICLQMRSPSKDYGRNRQRRNRDKVCIYAGNGNNGGDGFAIARHLYTRGVDVGIYMPVEAEGVSGDALTNLIIARRLGIPMISEEDIAEETRSADYVIDAMLGTGLCRELSGGYARAVETLNENAGYIIAVDIPTGVNSDTGKIMGAAVKADKTITIGLPKLGLYLYPGCLNVGEIEVADICIHDKLISDEEIYLEVTDDAYGKAMLPTRPARTNKGSYGKVFVFAGSAEMPGAACLTSQAAYRIGAGLVRACVVSSVADKIQGIAPEVVSRILPDYKGLLCQASFEAISESLAEASVLVIGPGLGAGECVDEFVYSVIKSADTQMVLDADALNSVAKNPDILHSMKQKCVITPHPGEMSRLMGKSIPEIMDNLIDTAREFSARYNVVTVLKDARTIIADPSGKVNINISGTPAMAKAGSGDVLAGIIGGLIAQGLSEYDASVLGCHIHGRAGELLERSHTVYSVMASDLINGIPKAISAILPDTDEYKKL